VGSTLSTTRRITIDDIARCGRLTGDFGSHHVSGIAGRQMAQGVLTLAIAPLFMNEGVHMSELAIKFLVPVFVDDTITATVEIVDIIDIPDGLVNLSCTLRVTNPDGVAVLEGTAIAQVTAEWVDSADLRPTPSRKEVAHVGPDQRGQVG
jgi:acyl dehydratase